MTNCLPIRSPTTTFPDDSDGDIPTALFALLFDLLWERRTEYFWRME